MANVITAKNPDQDWLASYLHPNLADSRPYKIDAPQVEIKLDQNESALDWPQELKDKVLKELAAMKWNRYPVAFSSTLRGLIADYAKVSQDCVLLGPGSNQLICYLLSTLGANLTGKLLIAKPSFPLYAQFCKSQGIEFSNWDLKDFEYDIDALKDLPDGSMLVFASPNNPVGNSLPYEVLQDLLKTNPKTYFVADEAYFEFMDRPYTPLLEHYDNLILIRTCSKTMGAAGLRLGYLIASPQLITEISKVTLPFALNHFTVAAFSTALKDKSFMAHVKDQCRKGIEERETLFSELRKISQELPFKVIPSQANFLLLKWDTLELCNEAYRHFIAHNILVRNVSNHSDLFACMRVSVGSSQENKAFLSSVKTLKFN